VKEWRSGGVEEWRSGGVESGEWRVESGGVEDLRTQDFGELQGNNLIIAVRVLYSNGDTGLPYCNSKSAAILSSTFIFLSRRLYGFGLAWIIGC
jgi:hypothetical protein